MNYIINYTVVGFVSLNLKIKPYFVAYLEQNAC